MGLQLVSTYEGDQLAYSGLVPFFDFPYILSHLSLSEKRDINQFQHMKTVEREI